MHVNPVQLTFQERERVVSHADGVVDYFFLKKRLDMCRFLEIRLLLTRVGNRIFPVD